ncbi:MAG: hypothetical protein EZS28_036902, partial [Streblomastix strix]
MLGITFDLSSHELEQRLCECERKRNSKKNRSEIGQILYGKGKSTLEKSFRNSGALRKIEHLLRILKQWRMLRDLLKEYELRIESSLLDNIIVPILRRVLQRGMKVLQRQEKRLNIAKIPPKRPNKVILAIQVQQSSSSTSASSSDIATSPQSASFRGHPPSQTPISISTSVIQIPNRTNSQSSPSTSHNTPIQLNISTSAIFDSSQPFNTPETPTFPSIPHTVLQLNNQRPRIPNRATSNSSTSQASIDPTSNALTSTSHSQSQTQSQTKMQQQGHTHDENFARKQIAMIKRGQQGQLGASVTSTLATHCGDRATLKEEVDTQEREDEGEMKERQEWDVEMKGWDEGRNKNNNSNNNKGKDNNEQERDDDKNMNNQEDGEVASTKSTADQPEDHDEDAEIDQEEIEQRLRRKKRAKQEDEGGFLEGRDDEDDDTEKARIRDKEKRKSSHLSMEDKDDTFIDQKG